jgi:hypothetical protein
LLFPVALLVPALVALEVGAAVWAALHAYELVWCAMRAHRPARCARPHRLPEPPPT